MQRELCWDCGVKVGEYHTANCDVARCPGCGGQFLMCGLECTPEAKRDEIFNKRAKFNGRWPGELECEEFDLWCYWGPPWVICDKDHPEAGHDLNRLYEGRFKWDIDQQRFVKQ